jgi:hypothetical protein
MSTLRVDSIQNTTGTDNQGKILQVVNDTTPRARHSSTSTVYIDTGFSVTITPKFANSKILINLSATVYSTQNYVYLDFYKSGVSLTGSATNGNGIVGPVANVNSAWDNVAVFYEDSPNTTSAVTYNLYGRTNSGTLYVGLDTSLAFPNSTYLSATEIAQ